MVAKQFGLEGLVAKRIYESGRRSDAWVKFKITKSQEFVIGGYTLPEGGRKYFGSVLVGYQSPRGLLFAGRVGTGFSDKDLADLYGAFQKLRVSSCPFVNLPEKRLGRWVQGITPAVMKRCLWVKPVLVAHIIYRMGARWPASSAGFLVASEPDKVPKDVVRELDREIPCPKSLKATKLDRRYSSEGLRGDASYFTGRQRGRHLQLVAAVPGCCIWRGVYPR